LNNIDAAIEGTGRFSDFLSRSFAFENEEVYNILDDYRQMLSEAV
jgi:hypothetical protein